MSGSDLSTILAVIVVFVLVFFMGAISMGATDTHKLGRDARNKIYKCEKSIPRNRHCVIVAKERDNEGL